MKIRMGFVSNSSSTSYVVALTRDFKMSPEQLEKFIGECKGYEEDAVVMTPEQAQEVVTGIIDALCTTSSWSWCDGYDISECDERMEHFHNFFWTVREDILVSDADGGHGSDFLHNILADDIQKKMPKLCKCKDKKDEDS